MRVIVLDTETTGVPQKGASIYETEKYPYIIQISWAIYDDEEKRVIEEKDYIISLSKNVEITQESINIHGITREISEMKGVSIREALFDLNVAFRSCNMMVAHNLSFDKRMVIVESKRNRIYINFPEKEYCTMKNSVNVCKIPIVLANGDNVYKFPKLVELYKYLYNTDETPENMHNSMVDVNICMKCYAALIELPPAPYTPYYKREPTTPHGEPVITVITQEEAGDDSSM